MVEADLDEVTLPFLGAPLRVTGWPRQQLRQIAGLAVEGEDVRSYLPPAPDVPPETQLLILAHRD